MEPERNIVFEQKQLLSDQYEVKRALEKDSRTTPLCPIFEFQPTKKWNELIEDYVEIPTK